MMTNLFSSFDPMSPSFSFQTNWMSMMIFFIVVFPSYWIFKSKSTILLSEISSQIRKEFLPLFKSNKNMLFFITLFTFILINNIFGLMPYTFTATSHLAVSLSLALSLWISFMIYGWINNTTHMFAHLVPLGTPVALMPFMVMIETVSNIIRPITLSVRLAANLTAGHLLLILISEGMVGQTITTVLPMTLAQLTLMVLEGAVAIIQAYVFATLVVLYASEV
uniref:ATP synthase F0 subunit 6 n=1 Tax=Paralepas cf. quadrata TaxID=2977351 RepID=UPI0021CCC086|nr:ATP synthase F0 subunit 6 [Paralepas cf. quadrata]UWM12977.1 ATP synthase F0 subunit 6 [Paralepas cf. quadrata]